MSTNPIKHALTLPFALLALALPTPTVAQAASAPVKEIEAVHIGREVDETTKGDICTVASSDKCQPAKFGSEPLTFTGGFGIASAPDGDIYIADKGNHRVQELTAAGEFVLMFGRDVNKTKEQEGAPQAQQDICTKTSGDTCQAGVRSEAPGELESPLSVATGPEGDVYVAELIESHSQVNDDQGERVQKFGATGEFLLEIGKEVNETTKKNLCVLGEQCKGPTLSEIPFFNGTGEPGAFNFGAHSGNILAVGGPGNLLYVADEYRVQEFESDGAYKTEISLASISNARQSQVSAVAVDKTGDVYLTYFLGDKFASLPEVLEFNPAGEQIKTFPAPGGALSGSVALDPAGRLAVTEFYPSSGPRGSLYDVSGSELHLITNFAEAGSNALAFDAAGDLYAINESEVLGYTVVPVGELLTTSVACAAEGEREGNTAFGCGLGGEVDAWGVKGTAVFFEMGRGGVLGERTPSQSVVNTGGEGEEEPFVAVTGAVKGLRPNETFQYRVAGEDANVKSPETLRSAVATFTTPLLAPKAIGAPSASFIKSASAVMSGELNPENATTEYFFEYAPEPQPGVNPLAGCVNARAEQCPGVQMTAGGVSAAYGPVGTTLEATGLQPASTYRYRLFAENKNSSGSETRQALAPAEGSFTTAPGPAPSASTGGASAVTSTGALVSGVVDPDGAPASYAFELGIYAGEGTQYGVVFSGTAGAGVEGVPQTLALTGLQPGTTYAYRVALSSGYIQNPGHTIQGAPQTFTTLGVPSLLASPVAPVQLATPAVAFPPVVVSRPTPKTLTGTQRLVKALDVCRREKAKGRRAACEKQARKKYKKAK